MQSNKQIALKWFDAFNNHDIEKLLELYSEQAVHYSPKLKIHKPETQGLISGKPTLRMWWTDAFERLPQLHYQILELTIEDDRVFMEYIRTTPGEDEMRVGEMLVIKEGTIVSSRVYHS